MSQSDYQSKIFNRNMKILQGLEQGLKPQQLACSFGISIATVYNVKKLAQQGGVTKLIPKSKAPITKPKWDDQIIKVILEYREQTGLGAEKIYDYLVSQSSELAITTENIPKPRKLHEILKEQGLVQNQKSIKKVHKPDYYQTRNKISPNNILEIDIKNDHFLEKRPVIVNGVIDICSKVATVNINANQSTENAALNLVDHVYRWGTPNKVKSDNDMAFIGQIQGSAFGLFTKVCLFLGIEHIFIPIHNPKWNPHIERFFRTWDKEFYTQIHHWGWDALIQGNRGFLQRYLEKRSHQGLKKLSNNPDNIKYPQQFHQKFAETKFPKLNKQEVINLIKKKKYHSLKARYHLFAEYHKMASWNLSKISLKFLKVMLP